MKRHALLLPTILLAGFAPAPQAGSGGPAHHWDLDDAASPAVDAGGAIPGTWRNGPVRSTEIPPAFGGVANTACLRFDGADDFVDLGTDLNLARSVGEVTLAYWVNMDDGFGDSAGLSISVGPPPGTSTTARAFLGIRAGGQVRAGGTAGDGGGVKHVDSPAEAVAAGQWAHVTAVISYSTDTVRIYKNGAQVATGTCSYTLTATTNTNAKNAAFGSNATGTAEFHKGRLDDVRVYNRALPAAEIRALAAPAPPPSLAATGGPLRVDLTWTVAPDNPALFNVYRTGASDSGPVLVAAGISGTSYTDTEVPPGDYQYVVRAVGVIESLDSPVAAATALVPPPRFNDHEEGLVDGKCACSAVPVPGAGAFLGFLAALAAVLLWIRV